DSRELEGKSVYNREGGYSAAELVMRVLDLPDGMPYYRPRLIFTAVYRYKTIANPMVCIDPEPRSTKVREKTCEIGDYSAVGRGGGSGRGGSVGSGLGSQGAPIAVTRVEEDVTSDFILFKIYLRNVGTGMVIPENVIDRNPNEGYDFREMNTVRIEHIKAGSILMSECRPAMGDYVELIDELGYIFCKLEKSTNSITEAYATPLNIELSYGYTTSEEREIEIFEEIDFR
ncbi:MAG: hypothetical protein U9O94_00835, partial [Nanoarchaeota archaeon]|nr:hypothetical protein [Nanoarchaeota archaeon]